MKGKLTAQFVDDLNRGAGADSVCSSSHHAGHVGSSADTSGGLHAGAITHDTAHESDVIRGSSAAEPSRGCLHEIRAAEQRELACQYLFFNGQEPGFNDH